MIRENVDLKIKYQISELDMFVDWLLVSTNLKKPI